MKSFYKTTFSIVFSWLLGSHSVLAQMPPSPIPSPIQMGAYLPGIMGVRDYANPGMSGLIAIDYNLFFNSNAYYDRYGEKNDNLELPEIGLSIPIDLDLSGYINALMVAYVSHELPYLGGARYMALISPYYATASFQAAFSELADSTNIVDGGASGFGDLGFSPLYLSWADKKGKFDITTGYLISAPTGRYETGADDNIGLGYWNHDFQLFTYYYPLPEKATALFLGNTFEVHSKIKDVDVKPGNRYTLEYGISQYLTERLEITVQGGHTWQVGEDSGDDVYWDSSVKDRNSVIGAGIGFWPVPAKFYTHFKWWTNYGMRQQFKAQILQLELIWIPWIRAKGTEEPTGAYLPAGRGRMRDLNLTRR